MRNTDVCGGVTPVALIKAQTATSTVTGTGQDVTAYVGIGKAVLSAGQATAGTTPTLDVKLQECDTVGGTYTDITGATFTQVTGAGGDVLESVAVDFDKCKKFVRALATIAGTNTPTFAFSVVLDGRKNVM